MARKNISKLPCESLVARVIGSDWREFSYNDIDGALGVAIVRSVLDGVRSDLRELESHLGVESGLLRSPFIRLSLNGVFMRSRIHDDRKALNRNELLAWCQYAGIASGATGNVGYRPRKPMSRNPSQSKNDR